MSILSTIAKIAKKGANVATASPGRKVATAVASGLGAALAGSAAGSAAGRAVSPTTSATPDPYYIQQGEGSTDSRARGFHPITGAPIAPQKQYYTEPTVQDSSFQAADATADQGSTISNEQFANSTNALGQAMYGGGQTSSMDDILRLQDERAKQNMNDWVTLAGKGFSPDQISGIMNARDDFYDTRLKTVSDKRQMEEQQASASDKNSIGLTPAQVNTTALQLTGRWDSEPTVVRYNVLKEQNAFVSQFDKNTKDPSQHQALIYAFAKVMDPESVVRESEYDAVGRYTQSLPAKVKAQISQAYAGTGILGPDAIKYLQGTINKKFKTQEQSYLNLEKSYQKQLDNLYSGGRPSLTSYQPSTESGQSSVQTRMGNIDINY